MEIYLKEGDTMPSVNEILSDVDVRYPKATIYTHAQKVGWMNDVQKKVLRQVI